VALELSSPGLFFIWEGMWTIWIISGNRG
jgi:hypothetical protein